VSGAVVRASFNAAAPKSATRKSPRYKCALIEDGAIEP